MERVRVPVVHHRMHGVDVIASAAYSTVAMSLAQVHLWMDLCLSGDQVFDHSCWLVLGSWIRCANTAAHWALLNLRKSAYDVLILLPSMAQASWLKTANRGSRELEQGRNTLWPGSSLGRSSWSEPLHGVARVL